MGHDGMNCYVYSQLVPILYSRDDTLCRYIRHKRYDQDHTPYRVQIQMLKTNLVAKNIQEQPSRNTVPLFLRDFPVQTQPGYGWSRILELSFFPLKLKQNTCFSIETKSFRPKSAK